MFFSDYGSFMHKVIEMYLRGQLKKSELTSHYLLNFKKEVIGKPPTRDIFKSYFEQGLSYLNSFNFPYEKTLAIEQKYNFTIDDVKFTGVIDCVPEDSNGLIVLDNKSRALKARSGRKKPTKSDRELDEYLKQLYIYSVPVKAEYGKYPSRLEFNCFRAQELISEPFDEEAFENAKEWALRTIDKIIENDDWSPDMEYWKCRYLCDKNHQCEYFLMNRR